MKLQIGIDGKTYEVEVEVTEDDTAPRPSYVPPTPGGGPTAPRAGERKIASGPAPVANEAKVCRSPIAGVVIRVNVQPGQQLQPNDLLLVLEAMKMETNVTAPVAGKVKAVNAQPGDAVTVQQVLVEFE